MRAVTDRLFPLTEWSSIDEFYADTTDLQTRYPDPAALAQLVKDSIFDATGLRCTVAVATGKTVAKIAADTHKPNGLTVVEPNGEAAFLCPRPLRALPGIGPKTAARLEPLGIKTIGDLLDPQLGSDASDASSALAFTGSESSPRDETTSRSWPTENPRALSHETTFEHDTQIDLP